MSSYHYEFLRMDRPDPINLVEEEASKVEKAPSKKWILSIIQDFDHSWKSWNLLDIECWNHGKSEEHL